MALNTKNRLKKKRDLEKVFKKGKAVRGNFLFIKRLKNELDDPRFGFVVSTKISRKATERNRIRRILSEAIRPLIGLIDNQDIVVFTNIKIKDASTEEIRKEIYSVLSPTKNK